MTALTRNLKRGMSGPDVMDVKELLFRLGYYAPSVTAVTKDRFGRDTLLAVRAFQEAMGLARDGIVGPLT